MTTFNQCSKIYRWYDITNTITRDELQPIKTNGTILNAITQSIFYNQHNINISLNQYSKYDEHNSTAVCIAYLEGTPSVLFINREQVEISIQIASNGDKTRSYHPHVCA